MEQSGSGAGKHEKRKQDNGSWRKKEKRSFSRGGRKEGKCKMNTSSKTQGDPNAATRGAYNLGEGKAWVRCSEMGSLICAQMR